jgi:hypothetical protein
MVSGLALALAACAADPGGDEPTDEATTEGLTSRAVTLRYEGTCDFLRSCSSYSRGVPEGSVKWGCEGIAACDDDEHWVAGPNHSYCGKTVTICKGSNCQRAKVRDVSVSHSWEGSTGLLRDLGLPAGLHGRCSGFGGGSVTVSY